jgi:succinate dehydrogenase/fumarate reductase flavoprotein subunit
LVLFSAKVVILATGGWHELFAFNTGSDELCGDGPAMALRAGARLTNMEMIAFCPNIILHPPAFRGSVLLYNFLTGKLLNAAGDEFLLWEDPEILGIAQTSEWNKLVYSRASWREIQAGRGSPNGGVYYSLRHVPEAIWEALAAKSRWRKGWKFQGKDFTPLIEKLRRGDAVEVAPGAHYFEGGVKVDAETRTDLSGLLAAGECSGELFGANRVSAATTEMLVQGARAGRRAVELLDGAEKGRPEPVVDEESLRDYIAPLGRPAGLRPAELKTEIQKEAYRCLGPIRRKMDLAGFLERIPQWRRSWTELSAPARLGHNRAWVDALEVRNLLDLAEATARSALARRESRGGHHRDDYPLLDNHGWLRSVLSRMSGPDFKIETEQTMITTHEPQGAVMTCDEAIRRALRLEGGGEDA